MSQITDLYAAWVEAEAAAQVGEGTLADAKEAKRAFADAAKELVASLPFKTQTLVREAATARVDAAEHIAPVKAIDLGNTDEPGFRRGAGQALCDRRIVFGETAVQVGRRAPSCARCLAVVEQLVAAG